MDKIKSISIPVNSRVIVISDIHGEINLFQNLLHKVEFCGDDYLIINGDLCEKGSNSKEVVQYAMELSQNNPNVHVLEGNCDTLVEDLLDENPKLIDYLLARKHALINEWLDEIGFSIGEQTKVQEIKELVMEKYNQEIQWLYHLPTVIETDKYLFVHAGLENCENWKETDRLNAISMPSFLEKEHHADKFVIVGHWPVVNYKSDIPTNNPIIDKKKKIIAIDGGNVIKSTGQLNAFIIQTADGEDSFSHMFVDHFPTCKVLKDFQANDVMAKGAIQYPHYDILPLQRGEHFTICRQIETNQQLYVKNEYIIKQDEDRFTVKADVSCAQISVRKGDRISLVDPNCSGYALIKKDGKLGWVLKETIM